MKIIYVIIILLSFLINCNEDKNKIEIKSKISESPKEMTIRAKGGLRLRDFPGITGNVIMLIPNGSKVKIFGFASETQKHDGVYGRWQKVVYNNYSGFVFSGFLIDDTISEYQEVPYVFSSEVETKLKNLFDYDLIDKIDFSKQSRLSELEESQLRNLTEIEKNGYRVILISPSDWSDPLKLE